MAKRHLSKTRSNFQWAIRTGEIAHQGPASREHLIFRGEIKIDLLKDHEQTLSVEIRAIFHPALRKLKDKRLEMRIVR